MAMVDYGHGHGHGHGHRNALPSINHLDLDAARIDSTKHDRHPTRPSLSLSAIVATSPTSTHSGPPPPYSANSHLSHSMHDRSNYVSPSKSSARHSFREDDEPTSAPKSLPSIHEALGSQTLLHSSLPPTNGPHIHQMTPTAGTPSAITSSPFPDMSRGLSTQFSQRSSPRGTPTTSSFPSNPTSLTRPDFARSDRPSFAPTHVDSTSTAAKPRGHPVSPRATTYSSTDRPETINHAPSISVLNGQPTSNHQPSNPPTFDVHRQADPARLPFGRLAYAAPYGETIKRHLDIYDADVAFNEIHEASTRTIEFSSYWSQRYHQMNRAHPAKEPMPSLQDIDDMMRNAQRIMENLSRVREMAVLQQAAIAEDRPQITGTSHPEPYRPAIDEYKAGGYTGSDAKKRRGKAAAPGRCHSCNRAETPEWRRGPDGARTLCNACGLHYAKLTRKLGANKVGTAPNTGADSHAPNLDGRS